ncbi:glycosyltransferase [Verrucomicrobiaceae bacterium 227]
MADDHTDDLIRTDYANLEDAQWWRELGGEGVVFYGWGAGKYGRIAGAIKEAGMVLVSHMDTGGLLGILNGPLVFGKGIWRVTRGEQSSLPVAIAQFSRRYIYAATVGLYFNDYRRALHLREADFIGAITPIALERIKQVCQFCGGRDLADRVSLIPHPIPEYMAYDKLTPKEELVVAIGRWDDERVKGTKLLADTIDLLLASESSVSVEIYGDPSKALIEWHLRLPSHDQSRIHLKGRQPNSQLRHALQRASISLCTSMRESFHIASAEALCSGASVVGPDIEELPGMKWFTEGEFGTLSPRTPEGLSAAVSAELAAWKEGLRDPSKISEIWSHRLHAPKVAAGILSKIDSVDLPET